MTPAGNKLFPFFIAIKAPLSIITSPLGAIDPIIHCFLASSLETFGKNQVQFSSASIFLIGLQVGAPLIVALFLANAIVGLLARSVPQIQVFVVGFPLTLLLGFLFLLFGMPFYGQALHQMFEKLDTQLFSVLTLLGG